MLILTPAMECRDKFNNTVHKSNKTEEGPIIIEIQDNGFAKIEVIADETPPAKVHHPALGIGTTPRYEMFKDKTYIKYIFEAGKFPIEVFFIK